MDSTQGAESPQDQSQPATDPLAIEQPAGSAEFSATMADPPASEPSTVEDATSSSTQLEQTQQPPPTSQEEQQTVNSTSSDTTSTVTTEATPSTDLVPTESAENVISPTVQEQPPQAIDPLAIHSAPAEATQPQKSELESTNTPQQAAQEPSLPSKITLAESGTNVSGSDDPIVSVTNVIPQVASPSLSESQESATAGPVESTAADTVATSSCVSASSSTNSSSNSFISSNSANNGSSNSLRNTVTSDNNLKINGISDLSILDVTQGNDDEIEVKVEGGSLMHKVIKFSLLNGMQDSSKRLENSRIIMSGVSNVNGEATLATTSSLGSRVTLGGGPLRQEDKAKEEGFKGGTPLPDSKTTPPACTSSTRPGSVEPSALFSSNSSSSSSDSSSLVNTSENNIENKSNRTEEASSGSRLRQSIDSAESEPAREETVSDTYCRSASLDFREWPKSTADAPSSAASTSTSDNTATITAAMPASSSGASLDLSNPPKETEQPSSAPDVAPSEAKRPKAMYYTELPDFSKPIFSAPNMSTTTATSTTSAGNHERTLSAAKSLSQLQMKTPDFSRVVQAAAPSHPPNQPSSSNIPSVPSALVSTSSRSHELQIANPDFSKSFAAKSHHQRTPPPSRMDERSPYMNPAAFAEISKQRNYISDLQLKNPPHPETSNQSHPSVVKMPQASSASGPSLTNYRIEKSHHPSKPAYPPSVMYRGQPETTSQVQLEEPKAHVIHKAATTSLPEPVKPWNPAMEYGAKPHNQHSDKDRYPLQYTTPGHKGPPHLTSEQQPHGYPGYLPYPVNKSKDPTQTVPSTSATHPGGIIVSNAKTYYPEPQHSLQPKSKEPEFRLEHKEKQLRQEGTIITLKPSETRSPVNNPNPGQGSQYQLQPPYHGHRTRSPSVERREAQMLASSQEILYRDFKLKQAYEMPPQPASSRPSLTSRPMEEQRTRPSPDSVPRDRSPYDQYYRTGMHPAGSSLAPVPSKYYSSEQLKQSASPASSATPSPTLLQPQNRSPVPIPPKSQHQPGPPPGSSSGMMHPPSGWPSQGRVVASPHGGVATSSPSSTPLSASPNQYLQRKNSPSPVHSYAPQPGPSHSYKSLSPSSSSSSPYGPPPPPAPITKYTQYYPSGNGERLVSIEIDKETYKPGYKGLDYNMEQKFAEVYQAHQMKEKQAAQSLPKQVDPYKCHPYPVPSGDYSRHASPHHQQQSIYKHTDHKQQDVHRDEYGRTRTMSTSAAHSQPPTGTPVVIGSRYSSSQENLNHYNQYYPPRMQTEAEIRKSEPQLYKPTSRDSSPAQKYSSNESLYHPAKQQHYPQNLPANAKAPQHPHYPPPGSDQPNAPSQYGLPQKGPYASYDRPPEKEQTVISTAYTQERTGSRVIYTESRQHPTPSPEHYPPTSQQYQPVPPQVKAPPSQPPYPQHSSSHATAPPVGRDQGWHYQQSQHHVPPLAPSQSQPGPSSYSSERLPVVRDERQNPVIQTPASKNIPVKVITTANNGPTTPSSTTVAPATSTTKRESPLDLSVKTVKTKADSTACDEYAHSSRSREVVPKVNFNPNFKKHIPERGAPENRNPASIGQSQPYHPQAPREPQPIPPQQYHHSQQPTASLAKVSAPLGPSPPEHRQMPVISPAIPPGYDKKTDAYMSANYRAVGSLGDMRDARGYPSPDNRYPPQPLRPAPQDQREHSLAYGLHPGSYPQRLPPGAPIPQHSYQMPQAGAHPKADSYYASSAKTTPSVSSRSVYYPPHEASRGSKNPPMQKQHMDDPRIEDRKFVESMLKKQASPSAEVIADLQAGKFSTRLPSTLAPSKKRPAETIPKTSPTKVSRIEEPPLHRPYESNYRHPQLPGPTAQKDYYPVPIKHEPVSPQAPGMYYGDKRTDAPSITRGVLNTSHHQIPQPHTVLQSNAQQHQARPPVIDSHPSVITSYHTNRPKEESPQQRDYKPSYAQHDDRPVYSKSEPPFRHSDPKYYGTPAVDKASSPSERPDDISHHQQHPTIIMQSHIQYSGSLPSHQSIQYKRPETIEQSTRPDYGNSNHVPRPTSIVENHQGRSYENIPRLINDTQKTNQEQRATLPYLHSSQESLTQTCSMASPQYRGVDQSVISKLRNSLELKERNNQLRKQTSSEEDTKPVDLNALPPSHFRSKGAMKAYTPIPAFDSPHPMPQEHLNHSQSPIEPIRHPSPVKDEPIEIPKDPIEPPADIEGASALDILDWGSACNEFVEQLQTGKKRGRRKRGIAAKRDPDTMPSHSDGFRSDLPGIASSALSEVPQEVLKSAAQEIGNFASSSDEDKPLHLLKQEQQQHNSTEELREEQLQVIRNSTMEKLSEKIARNIREKQRMELEQKHEAKLGRSSSSESESDNRRVVQRAKMRARKLRNRSSVPLKTSDVNTDGEDGEEEEEEDQARDLRKRKKLNQTSSDSEPGTQSKKLNRCQTQQIKQENGTDLSSDEEDPKTQSPGKKDKRLEVKTEHVRQGGQSDSDTNDVKTKESVNETKNREAEAQSSGSESTNSVKQPKKRGPKKLSKPRTTSRSKVVEDSSESEESSDEAETMTRSKSKLELEKRRSNSKVLRNDKIVGNFVKERKRHDSSVTPQKGRRGINNVKLEASKKRILDTDSDSKSVRKRGRKTSKLQTTSASESSEESDAATVSERLRSKKLKTSESSAPSSATKRCNSQEGRTPSKTAVDRKNTKTDPPKKRGRQPKKTSKDCASENTSENFYPGWEKELYEFKRSLKVPPQLITIGGRQYVHRISASLPDLDSHHSDESETFSEIVKKIKQKDVPTSKKVKTKAASKQNNKNNHLTKEQQVEEKKMEGNMKFSSIIEILHERMLRQTKKNKSKKSKSNNDKDTPKPKAEFELLPTPGAESEALFNRKKKSLFDTAIFKSRTRTEQKVMQSKEIIREVFGGDDERPQSAPPLGCVKDPKNVTYDEMYNDMLTKSNNVASFLAQKKLQKEKATASGSGQSTSKVKIDDMDDETQDSILKDSGRITEEGDTPSVVSERDLATPVSFRGVGKKKTHKSRRKGSSGFDYIRKKKKPVVNNGESSTPIVPKKKITSAFENLQSKDETHINKEIRSWVLNKGVGESVMHKAARLGYTDVIVYCLERLDMDPDLKDNAGYTPLHEACAKGHLDICSYLLQYGASHSETALSGIRPLHEAVENSFFEVVRLLLAFGADPMLATYAGQTPIQLAENNEMALFLENHLIDIQSMSPTKTGWKLDGPWKAHDIEESGCDLFTDIPGFLDDDNLHNNSGTTERSSISNSTARSDQLDDKSGCLLPPPPPPPPTAQSVPKRCDSNSNIMNFEVKTETELLYERKYKDCAVVLNDIQDFTNGRTTSSTAYVNGQLKHVQIKREFPDECNSTNGERFDDSEGNDEEENEDGEFIFEYEEADRPLPPLYLLKDEAVGEKWVLMTDLCNFLKLKSKEAVLRQICSNPVNLNAASNGTTNGSNVTRELIRELKIEDFLTRASCLQLLCAGEKLNINSNKVVLVKYNDNVRNLLQVQTFVTKI